MPVGTASAIGHRLASGIASEVMFPGSASPSAIGHCL
jgi:hypothetical protein